MCVFSVAVVRSTLCDPMDCRWPGSPAQGILPARILEWVAMPSSRGSSHPGIKPLSPVLLADSLPLRCFRSLRNMHIYMCVCVLHILFHYVFFLLQYNCFATLCWFLLYNNVNQPYVHISPPSRTSHPPLPHSTSLDPHGLLSWAPVLLLWILHMVVYIC